MAAHGLINYVGFSRIILIIVSLGVNEWLNLARIVRGQVLSLREQQFVLAARALGQSHAKIITHHLLPNLIGIVIVYLTLTIPAVILDESFLSFIGLGVQAPQASWGTLLSDGANVINPVRSNWWLLVLFRCRHERHPARPQLRRRRYSATPSTRASAGKIKGSAEGPGLGGMEGGKR